MTDPAPTPTDDPADSQAGRVAGDAPTHTAEPTTPPRAGVVYRTRPPRAGELSPGWQAGMAITWAAVILGFAAVWNASVQLGLSTWWLGPRADPEPLAIRLSPFVAPALMILATINHVRRLAWLGLVAAGVLAAIGIADLGRVVSIGVVEILIAVAAGAVSVASLTGTYRHNPNATPGSDDPATGELAGPTADS